MRGGVQRRPINEGVGTEGEGLINEGVGYRGGGAN